MDAKIGPRTSRVAKKEESVTNMYPVWKPKAANIEPDWNCGRFVCILLQPQCRFVFCVDSGFREPPEKGNGCRESPVLSKRQTRELC